jgi:AraC family transcriptional regulator, transcriptional activator of pobA
VLIHLAAPSSPGTRPETPIRAERFRSALQMRTLGRAGLGEAENVRAVLLERGEATLRTPDSSPIPLAGPVMGWFPWRDGMRLDLAAGAQGTHLLLGRVTLNRVLHRWPETAQLRFTVDRRLFLRLGEDAAASAQLDTCFAGILSETLHPGTLSGTIVESLLQVILVQLHRGQGQLGTPAAAHSGGGTALAERFTSLVEGHFRERWTVTRYAAEIGISRDRLHDICLRVHGRTPGRLIRERLLIEARIYLENSSLALDQIAEVLGFSGAAQFSRFFAALQGQPPGSYRNRHSAARAGHAGEMTLHSWP